jgi:hypothetical protein
MQDRNPLHYIPSEYEQRAKRWLDAAANLVSHNLPFISISIENLMYAEIPILDLEDKLTRRHNAVPHPSEPLLLIECSSLSLLWICGLYEVTRILNRSSAKTVFSNIHHRLAALRMPLAKHEVKGQDNQPHHPTSIWDPDTGHVGWSAYDPRTKKMESYSRTQLADEFLTMAKKVCQPPSPPAG